MVVPRELIAAVLTCELSLTRVRQHVPLEVAEVCEGFPTCVAYSGLLPCVTPVVPPQRLAALVQVPAGVAFELLHVRVTPAVRDEVPNLDKAFPTELTDVGPVVGVSALVDQKVGVGVVAVVFAAVAAHEGVDLVVLDQSFSIGEHLRAKLARVVAFLRGFRCFGVWQFSSERFQFFVFQRLD